MTRPRGKQINDPQTRYARHRVPMASGTVWSLVGANFTNFTNATVTQVAGGTDESASAYLVGSVAEPFSGIGVGNQFSVAISGVNGGNPMTVTLQAGDFVTLSAASVLTASFVAARINADLVAFGVTASPASSNAGKLQIRSAVGASFTVGDTTSVTIADVTPGIVQKLGFGAVATATATGVTAPVRGIVTRSADNRGGLLQARYNPREEVLLTRPARLLSIGGRAYVPDVSPGQAIYARVTENLTTPSWDLSWFTTGVTRPSISTSKSKFTTLGAGDILRITISDTEIAFSVNVDVDFGAGPAIVTVQDVINKINQTWHTSTDGSGLGAGRAIVTSLVPEPYQFTGTSAFQIILNGNAPIIVTLTTESTAEQVAATVTAAIAAAGQGAQATSAAITGADGLKRVEIRSLSIDGTVSSVMARVVAPQTTDALDRLGIAPGEYHGSVLATLFGGCEILIANPIRGQNLTSQIALGNQSGTPLAKFGLGAIGPVVPSFIAEEPATPPPDIFDTGLDILIPEVLEFGEVPSGVENVIPSFLSNRAERAAVPSEGIKNVGRFPGLDANGRIPSSAMLRLFDFIIASGIQLGANVTTSALALAARIQTPHSVASGQYTLFWESIAVPAPSVTNRPAMRMYGTNDGRVVFTVNAKWDGTNWTKDATSNLAASKVEFAPGNFGTQSLFSVWARGRLAAGSWNESQWSQTLLNVNIEDVSDTLWKVDLGAATTLACTAAPLLLQDVNTVATVALTGSTENANLLRVLDAPDPDATPKIFKRINSKWTVTVGDGTNSFGDFNGVNAIQQAIAFWIASTSFNRICIQAKSGVYNINAGAGAIVIPDGKGVQIQGTHRDGVVINVTDGVTPAVQVGSGGAGGTMWLRNLTISHSGPPFARVDVNSGGVLVADDVIFGGTVLKFTNASSYSLTRCNINTANSSADKPCIAFVMGDGATHGPFKAVDCTISAGADNPAMFIQSSGPAVALTNIGLIEYERCNINLLSTTATSSRLTGNCGVVDVDPAGSDATALTGVAVSRLAYRDCQVAANVGGGAVSILIHLQPQANGLAAGTGYLAVHRLEIDSGKWIANGSATIFAPFMIADVGAADLVHAGAYGAGKGGVFIRNVTVGFDRSGGTGFNMGTMTSDSKVWWLGVAGDAINAAVFAAFAVSSPYTEVTDVQTVGTSQLGVCCDWLFRWRELFVRNLTVSDYLLGGVSNPGSRIRLRPRLSAGLSDAKYANLNGVRCIGQTSGAGDWAIASVITLEPWTETTIVPPFLEQVVVENCIVQSYKQPGSPSQTGAWGIAVLSVANDALYTGSPAMAANLTIRGCHVSETFIGIGVGSLLSDQVFYNFKYTNNEVYDCTSFGINHQVGSGADWVGLLINANFVRACGIIATLPGIYVKIAAADSRPFAITNNTAFGNNAAGSTTQIQVEIAAPGSANDTPHGVIMGNNCRNLGTSGKIQLNALNGAGAVQVALVTPANVGATPIRGCETGNSITVIGERVFTDGSGMLHNVAVLKTP